MAVKQSLREPTQVVAGDSINFIRTLPDYPASAGWSILYALRGGAQIIEFQSAASGDSHSVTVDSATTEGWLPREYLLEGFAVNGVDRKQVYLASLFVTPDLATVPPDADLRSHAQRMLASIESQLEKLASNILDETDIQGDRIKRVQREQLYNLRTKYLREVQKEQARMNARSGKPTGRKIKSVFAITSTGPVVGAGDSVFNTRYP